MAPDENKTQLPAPYHARQGGRTMQRNLQNLERLFVKYQTRFGSEDDVVQKIGETLESQKSKYALNRQFNVHYPRVLRRTGGRLATAN